MEPLLSATPVRPARTASELQGASVVRVGPLERVVVKLRGPTSGDLRLDQLHHIKPFDSPSRHPTRKSSNEIQLDENSALPVTSRALRHDFHGYPHR